jgi:hypothetical protein
MSQTEAFAFRYEGDGEMRALRQVAADRTYVCGRTYWLVEARTQEYSSKSWRHLWAVLSKAFDSLPEGSDLWPDVDAFRKHLLLVAGFYNEVDIEVGDTATAGRIATSLRRIDGLSHVQVFNGHILQRTAKSMKDMGKEEFERAKSAIIEIAAELIGVTVDELTKQGE